MAGFGRSLGRGLIRNSLTSSAAITVFIVVGLGLLMLLGLRLIGFNHRRAIRRCSIPPLVAATHALVDYLRRQADSAIEDHGTGATVANLRIGDAHDHPGQVTYS